MLCNFCQSAVTCFHSVVTSHPLYRCACSKNRIIVRDGWSSQFPPGRSEFYIFKMQLLSNFLSISHFLSHLFFLKYGRERWHYYIRFADCTQLGCVIFFSLFLMFKIKEIFLIFPCLITLFFEHKSRIFLELEQRWIFFSRGKSLLESWGTTFLPDWQPPLIFVRFTLKSKENYLYY